MRTIISAILGAAVLGWVAAAEESNTNVAPTAAVLGEPGKPKSPSPEERAQSVGLTEGEVELSARVKLLSELADEHLRRAEEARAGMPGKVRWETDWAQELRNKRAELLGQLNDLTKRRLGSGAAHAPASPGALEGDQALNTHEYAYLSALDARLLKVRQELLAVDEAAKGYYSELQTNSTLEAMQRISGLLDESTKQSRQWGREESELQLKKLEFRALRK